MRELSDEEMRRPSSCRSIGRREYSLAIRRVSFVCPVGRVSCLKSIRLSWEASSCLHAGIVLEASDVGEAAAKRVEVLGMPLEAGMDVRGRILRLVEANMDPVNDGDAAVTACRANCSRLASG